MSKEKCQNLCKRRLVIYYVAFTATIKNNPLNLLSSLIQSMLRLVYVKYKKRKKKILIRLIVQVYHTVILSSRSVSNMKYLNLLHWISCTDGWKMYHTKSIRTYMKRYQTNPKDVQELILWQTRIHMALT